MMNVFQSSSLMKYIWMLYVIWMKIKFHVGMWNMYYAEVSKAINPPDSALVFKNLKFPHKCVSSSLKLCLTNFENKRSVIFWG